MHDAWLDPEIGPLRNENGGFTMVALDQRESLRDMFPGGTEVPASDDEIREFKRIAAETLTPHASGVLLDRVFAVTEAARPSFIAPGCGLLLAADVLHSEPGLGVVDSTLDAEITPEFVRATGAAALKYLVIWRRGQDSHRPALEAFHHLASESGVGTFVEGIVRPPRGVEWRDPADRHDAILEAARELSAGASVYKAEVPGYVPGDLTQVQDRSRELTAALDVPWVVLSNGVRREDFADAVAAAVRGGASGFLAGRAIWADTVGEPDVAEALATRSIARLTALTGIVTEAIRDRRDRA